jgi:hypothetical protein
MSLTLSDLFALKLCNKVDNGDAGIKDFAEVAVTMVKGSTAEEQVVNVLKQQLSFSKIFNQGLPSELAKVAPGEDTLKYLVNKFQSLDKAKLKLFLWNNYLLQSVAEYFAHVRMKKANTETGDNLFSEEAIKLSEDRIVLFWNAAQKLSH